MRLNEIQGKVIDKISIENRKFKEEFFEEGKSKKTSDPARLFANCAMKRKLGNVLNVKIELHV